MPRHIAKVRYTKAVLQCPHCNGPLPETWTKVDGLVRHAGADDELHLRGDCAISAHCPHCGRRYYFPERVK